MGWMFRGWFLPVVLVLGLAGAPALFAGDRRLAVPVVMDEATVRGRVVILETRREDRRTIQGLRIAVRDEAGKQVIHRTRTDDEGFFSLPVLPAGRYRITIGELRMDLLVQEAEEAAPGAGSAEPKIVLILLPKDVV